MENSDSEEIFGYVSGSSAWVPVQVDSDGAIVIDTE